MTHSFHPEALEEYQASALFYLREASLAASLSFVSMIEEGIQEILQSPQRWRVVESLEIRRYVCRRFPFILYYRHQSDGVVIYAVMHASRKPGYWKDRLE